MKIAITMNRDAIVDMTVENYTDIREIFTELGGDAKTLDEAYKLVDDVQNIKHKSPIGNFSYTNSIDYNKTELFLDFDDKFVQKSMKLCVGIIKLCLPFVGMAKSAISLFRNISDQIKERYEAFSKEFEIPEDKKRYAVVSFEFAGKIYWVTYCDDGYSKYLDRHSGPAEDGRIIDAYIKNKGGQKFIDSLDYALTNTEAAQREMDIWYVVTPDEAAQRGIGIMSFDRDDDNLSTDNLI